MSTELPDDDNDNDDSDDDDEDNLQLLARVCQQGRVLDGAQ